MKRFLLIDDDPSRLNNYYSFFDFLELEYLTGKTQFDEMNLTEFSGFILDVIYQKDGPYRDLTFDYVVDKLPQNKPIFIISADWQTVMTNRKIIKLRQQRRTLELLTWENITNEEHQGVTYIKDQAKTSWLLYNSQNMECVDKNQNLIILQISDLEFGSHLQTPFIKTDRQILLNQIRNDIKKFSKSKIDFLVVCGDIAFTGTREQYNDAKEWLSYFASELIAREDYQSRIMMVPGNHDHNIDSILGNFYHSHYDFSSKKFCIDKNDKFITHFNDLGINNYAHFLYDLTSDNSLLIKPDQPIICRRFGHIGINFILLNSVFFNEQMKFQYRLTDEYIATIIADSITTERNACNIIVSHFAPNHINSDDPASDATHHTMTKLVDVINGKLWLYGHAHSDPVVDDIQIGRKGNKTCLSRASALMLQYSGICDETSNGYTILNLKRQDGKVCGLQYLWSDKENGVKIKSIDTPFIS